MTVSPQIRDVPDDVRDAPAQAAREKGMSVQIYLLQLVERHARMLKNAKMFDDLATYRVSIPPGLDPTLLIRQWRDEK